MGLISNKCLICLTGTDTIVVGGLSVGEATKDVSDSSNIDVIQLTHELRRLFRNQILESDFVCLGFSSLGLYSSSHVVVHKEVPTGDTKTGRRIQNAW